MPVNIYSPSPSRIVPGVSSFADTLANAPATPRNNISPPSDSWLWLPLSGDTPTAATLLPTFSFGQALLGGGNGLGTGTVSFAATTYFFAAAICPLSLYVGSRYYTAKQKFVQIAFNSFSSSIQFGIGICNYLDSSGTGVGGSNNINHDAYVVDLAGTPLRLQRFNSVTTPTTLQAAGTIAQNDIIRASFDFTNSAQVTITVLKNTVQQYQIVDNAANRLPSSGLSFPIVTVYSALAGASALSANFSAGMGL